MIARHDEKTSTGRAKMLSGDDTGDRLAEVDQVLRCLVVQTVEHHPYSSLSQGPPSKVHIDGWVLGLARKINADSSPLSLP